MTELLVVTYGGGDPGESRRKLDRILDEVRAAGGSVLRTPLSGEQEQRLRATLDGAGLMEPAQATTSAEETKSSSPPSRPDLSSGDPDDPPIGTTPAALGTGTTPQA